MTSVAPSSPSSFRILIWAESAYEPPLDNAEYEIAQIELHGRRAGGVVEVVKDRPWSELAVAMAAFSPDIFHFIGHGRNGSLDTFDVDEENMRSRCLISPAKLAHTLQSGSPRLRGVFLSGCQTAHWAPHLIPHDGWFLGTTRDIDDDSIAFLSDSFYEFLCDRREPRGAFDEAMERTAAGGFGELPSATMWMEELDHDEFLHNVFSRQAFRITTRHESSFGDFDDALRGVDSSVRFGRIALRETLGAARFVRCSGELDPSLVRGIRQRLAVVQADLRQLRSSFPRLVTDPGYWTRVPAADTDFLNHLGERIDRSRDFLLRFVNSHLPDDKQLPLIGAG
ncbi:hypothetical protein GCM10009651_15460 [Microbacterium natoriense]|uniref:hypothetical protein n=1 Tax=Microbacterium TaxID=33882 RepID=UPI0011B0DA26|nr:hypothetical protein [Microbacterium sp. MYb72]